jgi:hypothetical protein
MDMPLFFLLEVEAFMSYGHTLVQSEENQVSENVHVLENITSLHLIIDNYLIYHFIIIILIHVFSS